MTAPNRTVLGARLGTCRAPAAGAWVAAAAIMVACPDPAGRGTSGQGQESGNAVQTASTGPARRDGGDGRDTAPGDGASGQPVDADGAEGPSAEGSADGTLDTGGEDASLGDDAGALAIDDAGDLPRPEPPPDYGLIHPPLPAPDPGDLVVHAVAGYEIVAVYSKPDLESAKLGFLRLGARAKVTKRVEGRDCPKGWHALAEGGFACASKGLLVDAARPPFLSVEPPGPALDEAMPYHWAYVRRWNSPHWWRLPKPEELAQAEVARARLEQERQGALAAAQAEKAAASSGGADDAGASSGSSTASLPTLDDTGGQDAGAAAPKPDGGGESEGGDAKAEGAGGGSKSSTIPAADASKSAGAGADATTGAATSGGEAVEVTPPGKLPLNPSMPWLERGFFIAYTATVRDEARSYWQTARGAFVAQSDANPYQTKDFQGVELTQGISFPVGFVMTKEAVLYELADGSKLKRVKSVPKRTFLDLREETEIGGKSYMVTTDDLLVRKDQLRIPELRAQPKGLEPWERWIDVSLDMQMLVAYEGARPVYVTLVSTGRKGSKEEPFDTPTGRWRIYSKQVTSNMDGATATDGNYAIQDVPWVMYFNGSYALHGAFWHDNFGYVRSHGCVNLGPSDARWLFYWTTPFLPSGWHGVNGTAASPGTTVIVRR